MAVAIPARVMIFHHVPGDNHPRMLMTGEYFRARYSMLSHQRMFHLIQRSLLHQDTLWYGRHANIVKLRS